MASFSLFVVIFVGLSSSSALPKGDERRKELNFSRKQVVDFSVDIIEAGQEYIEKIEVDIEKQTELFQVPSHPGVDRSDVLHDFKYNLTMIRFLESKMCYLFPLVKQQLTPDTLIRDLRNSKKMVIMETRRVDRTWILDREVTDRSGLGEALEEFCAQYSIYRVTEAREFMKVIGEDTKGRTNRVRRQSWSSMNGTNSTEPCKDGMDLTKAQQICAEPKKKCYEQRNCFKTVRCDRPTRSGFLPFGIWGINPFDLFSAQAASSSCWTDHPTTTIVCCKYVCDNGDDSADGPTGTGAPQVLQGRL